MAKSKKKASKKSAKKGCKIVGYTAYYPGENKHHVPEVSCIIYKTLAECEASWDVQDVIAEGAPVGIVELKQVRFKGQEPKTEKIDWDETCGD